MAGAVGATHPVASIQRPTAPQAATASVNAACQVAEAAVTDAASRYGHPGNMTSNSLEIATRSEAERMARAALAPFTFAALPQADVQSAIVAGDFNVPYQDTTGYTWQQRGILGGTNAYAALTNTTGGARSQAATTRIGPTAFQGQRIDTSRIPCPIQHANPNGANHVPLDMTSPVNGPTDFMGYGAWVAGLRNLPRTQNAPWAQLTQAPYADRLNNAFDSTRRSDDTSFYRANCYDNVFVRGATVVRSGMLDVMGEPGSWLAYTVPHPQPPNRPNPWPAAAARLNAITRAQLGRQGATLRFTYDNVTYDITPALADAEQAAVFFDRFISDHLPVAVEIRIRCAPRLSNGLTGRVRRPCSGDEKSRFHPIGRRSRAAPERAIRPDRDRPLGQR